jgi:hypothetical protein
MITVTNEPAGTRIKVDGWLEGDGVAALERVLAATPAPARLLARDLRGADGAGLSVLRRLTEQGMPLEELSPYMQLLLTKPTTSGSFDARSPVRPETPVRSNET